MMRMLTIILAASWAAAWANPANGAEGVAAGKDGPADSATSQQPTGEAALPAAEPIHLRPGPHLFIDDYLIAESSGIRRRVKSPDRVPENPLVPNTLPGGAAASSCSDNQVTVIYDAEAKLYKMWNAVDARNNPEVVKSMVEGAVAARWTPAYRESRDGLHWGPPILTVSGGALVLYDPAAPTPDDRYKTAYFQFGATRMMNVFFSADGIHWRLFGGKPVLYCGDNDIWAPSYDPLLRKYFIVMKPWMPHQWTDVHGKEYSASLRQTWITSSTDFKQWSEPRLLFVPDTKDEGITQWYGATGGIRRGEHFIVFLRELRDDLKATRAPGDDTRSEPESYNGGIGYTVLMWTTDGEHWQRDRYTDKFLAPDPNPAAWDHAHTWIGCCLPQGDQFWLYYGGYKYGHKYYKDRCIGLAKMERDRFVAREADAQGGTLLTRPVIFRGNYITVNACVRGKLQARLLDTSGKPIPGFDAEDCPAIHGDSVALPVRWKGSLSAIEDRPVQIEFQMSDAQLYAFDVTE